MRTLSVYRVTPNLLTRGCLPAWPADALYAALTGLGVTHVVTLTVRGEPALVADRDGIILRHHPMHDGNPDKTAIERAVDDVVSIVRAGGRALVMCHAGKNRTYLVIARALVRLHGWTAARAIAEARRIRPGAIANDAFVTYIMEAK